MMNVLLNEFSGSGGIHYIDKSITDIFSMRVKEFPHKVAIDSYEQQYTYQEVDRLSDDIARQLATRGITEGNIVGVFIKRSPLLVISQLAILKANATYVPLDPAYPEDRLQYMIRDSGLSLIIKDNSEIPGADKFEFLCYTPELKEGSENEVVPANAGPRTPESSAYIIYTSGTTGMPKGVEIADKGIVRLVYNNDLYPISDEDVSMFSASVAFDASVLEIWSALLNGARLIVLPDKLPSLEEMSALMNIKKVSASFITTPLFHQLIAHFPESFNTVSKVWTGGDVISKSLLIRLFELYPNITVYNCYGPTENSVVTTIQIVNQTNLSSFDYSIPIGRPIPGTTTYILDEHLQPVPIGVKGELYTGGLGVAKGYVNKEHLTRQAFINDPFSTDGNSRLYKTGDIVRYTPNGQIEFFGREDSQVKIRGYRIEPGEVEMRLSQCSNVQLCVVKAVEDLKNEKSIIAYIVPQDPKDASEKAYRKELAESLPNFMLPACFVLLDSFPLTPNGKIDKNNLPNPFNFIFDDSHNVDNLSLPDTHSYIANLWKDIMDVPFIKSDSNFFSLGGNSLHAAVIIGKIRKEKGLDILVQTLFENPVLYSFAECVEACSKIQVPPVLLESNCLSSAQERLLFLERMGFLTEGVYNIPVGFEISGPVDVHILKKSIERLIKRHEVLRAGFRMDGEQASLFYVSDIEDTLNVRDWSHLLPNEAEHLAQEEIMTTAAKPFDLQKGGLFRTSLLRVTPDRSIFTLVIHHIICDGWSLGLLLQEISELYNAYTQGIELRDEGQVLSFKNYVYYENSLKKESQLEKSQEFWENELKDLSEQYSLPLDSKRPSQESFKGSWIERRLDKELSRKIKEFAMLEEVTVHCVLLAAFNIMLAKYTGMEDQCIGTPFLNRVENEFQNIVGFFSNTVVIRNQVVGNLSYSEFIQEVQAKTKLVFKHAHIAFDDVVRIGGKSRSTAYNPIFQIVFSHQDFSNLKLDFRDTVCRMIGNKSMNSGTAKFDLSMFTSFDEDMLRLELEYATDIFSENTVETMIDRFIYLIETILSAPSAKISATSLLDERKQHQMLETYSGFKSEYPQDKSVASIFREVAAAHHNKTALLFANDTLTYAQLDVYSDALSFELSAQGVCRGDRVAISMDRSMEQIIAVLAILKSGASYVPIDYRYPDERMHFMIQDTRCRLAIVDEHSCSTIRKFGVSVLTVNMDSIRYLVDTNEFAAPLIEGEWGRDEAYVLYTSGSTGQPKAIMVPNRAIARLVLHTNYIPLTEDNTFLHMASMSFDAATFEIWAPLLNGWKLALYPDRIPDPEEFRNIVKEKRVTHCWLTTGLFNSIVDEDVSALEGVPFIFTGGEKISEEHVRRAVQANSAQEIINCYGPTENTTFTCTFSSKEWNTDEDTFPIGYPIANTYCYILDENRIPLPEGIVGDLYVGGDGLALGYLNRADLTEEVFVNSPFAPGKIMYKTGDKARYRRDGSIEYIGRADDQVKIRGFRIELKEIEKVLSAVPGIASSAVIVRDTRLLAYYTSSTAEGVSEYYVQRSLHERLPEYMVPLAFMQLEKLPLNVNGKVDRKRLPEMNFGHNDLKKRLEHTYTSTELIVCEICQDILDVAKVEISDDFFALGGHSLLLYKLVARLNQKFEIKMGLAEVYKNSTILGISEAIVNHSANRHLLPYAGKRKPAGADHGELSFSQQRLWLFDQLNPDQRIFNMPIKLEFKGRLNVKVLEETINVLLSRHQSLRTNFQAEEGKVTQRVRSSRVCQLPVVHLRTTEEAELLVAEEIQKPFNLETDSLIRHQLLSILKKNHILLITMHHIISDGWSFEIYLKEFSLIYESIVTKTEYSLPELQYNYLDFVQFEKERMVSSEFKNDMEELSAILEDLPSSTLLPSDYARTEQKQFKAKRTSLEIEPGTIEAIRGVAKRHGASLNMTVLAVFHALIYRMTAQEKIVTGSPMTNREGSEFENIMGFFVNNLVNVTDIRDDMSFDELLSQVRNRSLQMYRLGYIPFEYILDFTKKERRVDQTPIFQMMFNWLDNKIEKLDLGSLHADIYWDALPGSKFDLTLYALEADSRLKLDLVYDSGLFKKERMELLLRDFESLLAEFAVSPGRTIIDPQLISSHDSALPNSLERLEYRPSGTVLDRFKCNAERNPYKAAICYGTERLHYLDLDVRSSSRMKRLAEAGFKKGDIIPIFAERNPELIITILAILKLGCCFSIIDAGYTCERVRMLLEVLKCTRLVHIIREDPNDLIQSLSADPGELFILDCSVNVPYAVMPENNVSEIPSAVNPDMPMYICFTSGSSGVPKAVVSSHASVFQSLEWFIDYFEVQENDRFANLAGVSHDPLIRDIFVPLCANAELFIPTANLLDKPAKIGNWMYDSQVTIIAHTPPSLAEILSISWENRSHVLDQLRLVCFTGESLRRSHVVSFTEIAPQAKAVNFYGATEAPQVRSFLEVDESVLTGKNVIPVGKGIRDTQLLILNKSNKMCGVGELGEICIRTPYLSLGYLGEKETTDQVFQKEPGSGDRYMLYKTGDYGRYLPTGYIEFGGRKDRQIKVRGYRVELDEIEQTLSQMPGVQLAAVKTQKKDDDNEQIVAFYIPSSENSISFKEMREHLLKTLPQYMIPIGIDLIYEMPRTRSGKIDYRSLVFGGRLPSLQTTIQPTTEVQMLLFNVFSKVLKVENIGVNDNFFDIGGNSLLGFQIIAEINRLLYLNLGLKEIFLFPTIETLADNIESILLEDEMEHSLV
ncbi:non-ribosomal peptide synthetase [Paenibacillus agri]|uniref:Amino acid adenylation domain-containing protein n=1 Tax=Paenibacillus agri TaxID=2744309 RepID=A0A850EI54_9BACL|nr:non-ribosomal peptide synthetase [Paenibacillus agri]NUU60568.1 amino acid adenylation domain-containing protein [Paenibacillus agri]